jgi:hypothetical protein
MGLVSEEQWYHQIETRLLQWEQYLRMRMQVLAQQVQ